MKPKVSLIIPVYNVEKYLKNCLESAINQTFKNIEIILINDGSTDDSLSICKEYKKKDPRICLINQKNGGLSAARNSGIRVAKGKYLSFLDSDDTIELNMIEEVVSFCENENLDIAVYGYTKQYENGKIIAKPDFGDKIINNDEARRMSISLKLSPMACNKMYKRNLFYENDIKFPINFLHEDIGTTYKLFWNAKKVGIIPKSYYNWMVRHSSITGSFKKKHIEDIIFLLHEKKKFLQEIGEIGNYIKEYIESFYKILILLLERGMKKSSINNNILNYLLEKIEVYDSIENQEILKSNNLTLYKKYNAILKSAKKLNDSIINQKYFNKKSILLIQHKLNLNSFKNYFFPIESKRREIIKKIINIQRSKNER